MIYDMIYDISCKLLIPYRGLANNNYKLNWKTGYKNTEI